MNHSGNDKYGQQIIAVIEKAKKRFEVIPDEKEVLMNNLSFTYTRTRLFSGYDGTTCKVCPAIMQDGGNNAYMTWGMLLLNSCDVCKKSFVSKSTDGGQTFGNPTPLAPIETMENGIRSSCGFTPYYNRYHKKWLGIGSRTYYENDKIPMEIAGISIGDPVFTFFDPERGDYDPEAVRPIPVPFDTVCAFPHGTVLEYENGDMLLAFYVCTREMPQAGVLTVRYALTEDGMQIVRAGTLLRGDGYARGFCEPTVSELHGTYYLTIRTDEIGLLSASSDGYTFSKPEPWHWVDGSVLENYNTMQRWVRSPDGLFLVYTRRGAHNDHVFRHRAPLFMARFDEKRLCLERDTEVILVPEMGARLGNFFVTEVSERETWVSAAEWMQPEGCERYGSDNSIWIAKIRWN